MSAHSKDLDPVSVIADAENRSKTRAYQTVSGVLAIIGARRSDHDHVQAMTAVKGFGGKWIAVNPLDTIVFGMTQHQTVIQSKMTLAGSCGWLILGTPVS